MSSPLLDELLQLVTSAPVEELPRVEGVLYECLALAQLRRATAPAPERTGSDAEEQLAVDLPTASKMTGLPEDYLRTLSRQRRIPTIRPPSTKPGKADGKYVRILVSDLQRFMEAHRDAGIAARIPLSATKHTG